VRGFTSRATLILRENGLNHAVHRKTPALMLFWSSAGAIHDKTDAVPERARLSAGGIHGADARGDLLG
jgi:hypothetical protein